jgi:hypothetical protein
MFPPQQKVKIYHITHHSNLPGIIECGGLLCDGEAARQGPVSIAYGRLKERRFETLVPCEPFGALTVCSFLLCSTLSHALCHSQGVCNTLYGRVMESTVWHNTPEDPDRKRRRQAEFLVYRFLPLEAVETIAVYDLDMRRQVQSYLGDPVSN